MSLALEYAELPWEADNMAGGTRVHSVGAWAVDKGKPSRG